MKTKLLSGVRLLAGITGLLIGANMGAAPLTWFPGPPLGDARSDAATTIFSGNNLLIGGDSSGTQDFLVEELAATNVYWTYPQSYLFYYSTLAAGAVGVGGLVVYFGGNDGTAATSATISYSPSDGSTVLASMSVPRSYLGYASDRSGNAYAFGGLDGNGQPLSSAEMYSQDNTNWTAIANLPTALYNFPAVSDHTNYIYAFGGFTNATTGTETATVFRYSLSANTWTERAPMPIAVAGSAAAFGADGKIYVVGGTFGGVTTNVVQVYSPGANAWTISTPLPESLNAAAMGVDSLGRLIVMGGAGTNGSDVSDVWRSQQLGIPDSAPAFTQYPATNAFYAATYSSAVSAVGNPQPVYLLVSGPTNMAVDFYTGVITWTPLGADQIGNIPVTVQATSYAGSTNWNFTVAVPPPPPIIPTNVVITAVTDDSITLTWDSENPLCGPATYKIYRVTAAGGKGGSHPVYTLIGGSATNSATIGGLTMGNAYYFVVTATVGSVTTGYSFEVGAYTTSPQPPPNVRLTGLTSTTLSLAWDVPAGPTQSPGYSAITSYSIVQYFPGGGASYHVTPVVSGIPTNTTTGTVTGLTPGTSAFWTVQAFDAQGIGSSPLYNILSVTNPVPASAVLKSVAPSLSSSGGFQFTASAGGSVLQTVLIQATATPWDSNSWVQIASLLPVASPFTFTDTNAALYPLRFYRIVSP